MIIYAKESPPISLPTSPPMKRAWVGSLQYGSKNCNSCKFHPTYNLSKYLRVKLRKSSSQESVPASAKCASSSLFPKMHRIKENNWLFLNFVKIHTFSIVIIYALCLWALVNVIVLWISCVPFDRKLRWNIETLK